MAAIDRSRGAAKIEVMERILRRDRTLLALGLLAGGVLAFALPQSSLADSLAWIDRWIVQPHGLEMLYTMLCG